MKRSPLLMAATVATLLATSSLWAAERRSQDPTEEEVAKINAAAPKTAKVQPVTPRKMLVLSYQSHDRGRFAGEKALEIMAGQTGAFELVFVRDTTAMAEIMVPEKLKEFDAICVNKWTFANSQTVL